MKPFYWHEDFVWEPYGDIPIWDTHTKSNIEINDHNKELVEAVFNKYDRLNLTIKQYLNIVYIIMNNLPTNKERVNILNIVSDLAYDYIKDIPVCLILLDRCNNKFYKFDVLGKTNILK